MGSKILKTLILIITLFGITGCVSEKEPENQLEKKISDFEDIKTKKTEFTNYSIKDITFDLSNNLELTKKDENNMTFLIKDTNSDNFLILLVNVITLSEEFIFHDLDDFSSLEIKSYKDMAYEDSTMIIYENDAKETKDFYIFNIIFSNKIEKNKHVNHIRSIYDKNKKTTYLFHFSTLAQNFDASQLEIINDTFDSIKKYE